MPDNQKLETLYSYWVNAIDIWAYAGHGLNMKEIVPSKVESVLSIHHNFIRLTIAYALLYVVIEAYQELGFSNKKIDELLKNTDYTSHLKRLRNSVFHFQNEYPLTPKAADFAIMAGSKVWINDVKKAFEEFFVQNISYVREFLNKYKGGKKEK